jgi:choline dehydrogenase
MKRPNLQVVTRALVHRILFDGKRAIGVEFERAEVDREVILSAGAVGSPHILQLSSVGSPEHLGRIGIAVHHDSPGVGQNLQGHYIARISYTVQV